MALVIIHRDELFEKVWSKAVQHVASDYGVSGTGLAKICRKLAVPVPPRGYWARIAAGGAAKRPRLPQLKKGETDRHIIQHSQWKERERESAREAVAASTKDAGPPVVIDASAEPHRLIKKHGPLVRKLAKELKPLPADRECLDVVVSETTVDRALLIIDAVLRAIDARGWRVQVTKPHRRSAYNSPWTTTAAVIDDHLVEFGLEEELDSVVVGHRPRSSVLESVFPRGPEPIHERRSTGRLRLQIKVALPMPRRSWGDGKTQKLEDLLGNFIDGLHIACAARKVEVERERLAALERERDEIRQREEARRRYEEQTRIVDLDRRLAAWQRAQAVLAFAAEAEGRNADGAISDLVSWTKDYAHRLERAAFAATSQR